jgi:hypothetical protein
MRGCCVVAWVMLALTGCAGPDRLTGPGSGPHAPVGDSDTMRAVTGQNPTSEPLTPEPGDIWADLQFLKPGAAPPERPPESSSPTPLPPATVAAIHPGHVSPPAAAPSPFSVQLAVASSEDAARGVWQRLQHHLPMWMAGACGACAQEALPRATKPRRSANRSKAGKGSAG